MRRGKKFIGEDYRGIDRRTATFYCRFWAGFLFWR